MKYSVNGRIRFISHLDLIRVFFRSCIKKGIPVEVSKGFSPHLKLSFGPPLSVGTTSRCEFLDLYLTKPADLEKLKNDLKEALPEGLEIKEVKEIDRNEQSLNQKLCYAKYTIEIPQDKIKGVDNRIKGYTNSLINKMILEGNKLFIDVSIGQKRNVRPIDVLKGLWPETDMDELKLWRVNREELYS